ncbi:MAG TPA: hypothetical protein ENJ95_20900 [Bacteroidetes bacterium]|nr:hypothetical protein [Bacteroidota bacterium]
MKNLVKIYTLLALAIIALSPLTGNAQADISGSCGTPTVIDFAGFAGAGFDPSPSAGQLDSDTWSTDGFSNPSVPFGGSASTGDAARGNTGGGVSSGGVYNYNGGNGALWIQPTGADFTPGTVTLKACNNTMSMMADIDLGYDILYLNDGGRANLFNFSYSNDDATYTDVPALDFTTPQASDALGVQTLSLSTVISGANLASGSCLFFRWTGNDVSGSGPRDEFGLDNISLCASSGGGGGGTAGQVNISDNCGAPTLIDFAGFTGTGFSPSPAAGQLSSNAWAITGFSEGNLAFGGTRTTGDFAEGTTAGGMEPGGLFSYTGNGNNGAIWIQPSGADFTPGNLTLKACNNTMDVMVDLEISYDILYLNSGGSGANSDDGSGTRSNSFNFSYSTDDMTYTPVLALDFATPGAGDPAATVQTVPKSTVIPGLNIASGTCAFLRWSSNDMGGSGFRDEIGLDNISLCASGTLPPPPPPGNPSCIASDDFDSPTNLISRTVTVDMAFVNLGDIFGVANPFSGAPNFAPFSLIDDTNISCFNSSPTDNQGVIPCDYGNQFFGMVDTENPNNMGPVSAEWVFDISYAANLSSISMDMSAMGDFETSNDVFLWSYSIDGAPFTTIFTMVPDESINATYTLQNGSTRTLNDPMTVNGTVLLNQLTHFSAPISGAGSQLTLRLEGMGNGGTEALAWDNIKISGVKIGAAVVPTMGEWAMFLFALIMISIGVVFVFNAQQRLAVGGTNNVSSSFGIRQFPFEAGIFKVALKHAFGLAIAGFAFIFFAWGEIVPADLIGMALAIPVAAYLIHLVKLFGEE